jgi:hypothetical protein
MMKPSKDKLMPGGLDKNVAPNWKPVETLDKRRPGMMFSDRVFYWLISLGGIALAAAGVGVIWLTHHRIGLLLIAFGIAVFIFGGPSQSARNGYRN